MDSSAPRPRRRWLQFSLRSILVLTAVVAVLIARLGPKFYIAREQRQAVEAILASGGEVYYDFRLGGAKEPRAPSRLRNLIGDDFFREADGVVFNAPNLKDAKLSALRRLPHLKDLSIYLGASDRCDLSALAELHSLERLYLRGNGCTDLHLSAIAGLISLQSLTVDSRSITDAGLGHLQGLTNLRELHINGNVTGAGALRLKSLTKLTTLEFTHAVGNVWIHDLANALDKPTYCDFSETPVPDVATYFSDRHGIPIDLDMADPAVAKQINSSAITISLSSVDLRTALDTVLKPVGPGCTSMRGGLLITTREKAAENRRGLEELKKSLPNLTTVKTDW